MKEKLESEAKPSTRVVSVGVSAVDSTVRLSTESLVAIHLIARRAGTTCTRLNSRFCCLCREPFAVVESTKDHVASFWGVDCVATASTSLLIKLESAGCPMLRSERLEIRHTHSSPFLKTRSEHIFSPN